VILATLLFAGPAGSAVARAQPPNEYEVKAAFLYNFAKFVQWPPSAFDSHEDELTICVLGDDPFRGALEAIVAGKSVHGHQIAVRHVDADDAPKCHVLFLAATARYRTRPILAAVAGRHVLTVGDHGDFANHGGMIAFRVEDHRIRFVINTGAAAESGIEISSQLLKVAESVIAEPVTPR